MTSASTDAAASASTSAPAPGGAIEPATRAAFPFSALVGQPELQRALLLAAIDPAIGGVLISGPRGTAKSTAARALAALLPALPPQAKSQTQPQTQPQSLLQTQTQTQTQMQAQTQPQPAPFVTLPLSASIEQLVGTLNVEDVLRDGRLRLQPGLLARAHQGVLYVDEVNLLPDALVDALLDVAASGVNTIERDGISQQHAARFVLIGTMNPEEGELRPQLLDRFGLSVVLANPTDAEQRMAILRARLHFDEQPAALADRHAGDQARLADAVAAARAALPGLAWSDAVLHRAAAHALAAGVDGMRADLVMLRAARALAAFENRREITPADVDAVAALALAHRRSAHGDASMPAAPSNARQASGRPSPPASANHRGEAAPAEPPPHEISPSDSGWRGPRSGGSRESSIHDLAPRDGGAREAASRQSPTRESNAREQPADTSSPGDWGALPPRPEATTRVLSAGGWPASMSHRRPMLRPRCGGSRWLEAHRSSSAAPASVAASDHAGGGTSAAIAWLPSLIAKGCGPLRREHLRHPPRCTQPTRLHFIVLDTSGSMRRGGRLALAKGHATWLIEQAARAGDDVALLSFGGQGTALQLPPGRARAARSAQVRPLGGGGGTPLTDALVHADRVLQRTARRNGPIDVWLWLLTDGRTLESPVAPRAAQQIVIVDFDEPLRGIGRCAVWATRWGAEHRIASPPAGMSPAAA